jgi:hypothetical protein
MVTFTCSSGKGQNCFLLFAISSPAMYRRKEPARGSQNREFFACFFTVAAGGPRSLSGHHQLANTTLLK